MIHNHVNHPFWSEQVPRQWRTTHWLEQTSTDLLAAARSWDSPFRVSADDIASRLDASDEVVVLRSADRVIGFVAASHIVRMPRTGHAARYIAGTIVHRDIGGKQKFNRLMNGLTGRAEIEVLHTQSPCMAKALAARNRAIFPSFDTGVRLAHMTYLDLQDLLRRMERNPGFNPATGVSATFYEHCLYENWPISGEAYEGSFSHLLDDSTGAVVVVGFADAATAGQNLTRGGRAA